MSEGKVESNAHRSGREGVLHPELRSYVEDVLEQLRAIPESRKEKLWPLVLFVRRSVEANERVNLTFICTHNSRRSQMGQLWAAAAAAFYGVDDVHTFAGGTEVTAFNPRAVAAIQRAGFHVETPDGKNPRYRVTYGPSAPAIECFSKEYDHPANPSDGFAAILTCSEADANCPVVRGAAARFALPYVDPKEADGTPAEARRYDERCMQIAIEMFYAFSQVAE